jgi:hypothetical protein
MDGFIMLRYTALTLALILLSGCKLAVILVEGGEVQSLTSGTCSIDSIGSGKVCIHEISDTSFSESFTAVPDDGWRFVRWNTGSNFFCENLLHPNCALPLESLSGNPAAEALVAEDKAYYIMPVFEVAPDTIIVNGKEWYQPYLFTNLSAEDISVVCPNGVCNGTLNGRDLTGWTWASVEDFNNLANYYVGAIVMGPGSPDPSFPYYADSLGSSWIKAFYADGWRDTYVDEAPYHILFGWINGGVDPVTAYIGEVTNASSVGAYNQDDPYGFGDIVGAWFNRPAP